MRRSEEVPADEGSGFGAAALDRLRADDLRRYLAACERARGLSAGIGGHDDDDASAAGDDDDERAARRRRYGRQHYHFVYLDHYDRSYFAFDGDGTCPVCAGREG